MLHHARVLQILNRQRTAFTIREIEHKLDLERYNDDPHIVTAEVQEEIDYLVAAGLVRIIPSGSGYILGDNWGDLDPDDRDIWLCHGTDYRSRPELDNPLYFARTTPLEYAWESKNWWSFNFCVVRPSDEGESNVAIATGLCQGGFTSIGDIKHRIVSSLSSWYLTPAGAAAWASSMADFNIGDLFASDYELTDLLRQNGIRNLSIADAIASLDWQYDDILGCLPESEDADLDSIPDFPETAPTIAQLNDRCRTSLTTTEQIPNFRVVVTRGIASLPTKDSDAISVAIRDYAGFTAEDDPYGEHYFGVITTSWGVRVFWKFDYFDLQMEFGSENPRDPNVTIRVLTIMLAEEY